MVGYAWPGNIRQLQNFIERSVIVSNGRELRAPIGELTNANTPTLNGRTLADADRAHIVHGAIEPELDARKRSSFIQSP
jgi:formate hydrogenlyase transcriptional activator